MMKINHNSNVAVVVGDDDDDDAVVVVAVVGVVGDDNVRLYHVNLIEQQEVAMINLVMK